jgi:hypothetical protein
VEKIEGFSFDGHPTSKEEESLLLMAGGEEALATCWLAS